MQTRKIESFPVVLMGRDYWEPLIAFMRDTLAKQGTIDASDLDLLTVTDSSEEAMAAVMKGLERVASKRPEMKRRWWLAEGR